MQYPKSVYFAWLVVTAATWPIHSSGHEIDIQFLSSDEGGMALAGDADDEFMADMFPREAAAMMAQPRGERTVEESRKAVRQFFPQRSTRLYGSGKEGPKQSSGEGRKTLR